MNSTLFVPTAILFGALVTDVRTRKIPNLWVIVSIVFAIANSYYFFEFDGLRQGAQAAGLALLLTLPLVLVGALGAGDMKLMFAFGFSTTYGAVFSVIVFSFVWAALIGIALAISQGRLITLMQNTFRIVTAKNKSEMQLQKIPYTIALVLGWVTYLLFGVAQGAF